MFKPAELLDYNSRPIDTKYNDLVERLRKGDLKGIDCHDVQQLINTVQANIDRTDFILENEFLMRTQFLEYSSVKWQLKQDLFILTNLQKIQRFQQDNLKTFQVNSSVNKGQ